MPKTVNTKQKTIVMIISVLLVVAIGVGASLAYLTDLRKEDISYTVGKVDVTLTGTKLREPETLYPGRSYTKAPKITLGSKSEDCFVRLRVEFPPELALVMNPLKADDADAEWIFEQEGDRIYYFTYKKMLSQGATVDTSPAFEKVVAKSRKPEVPLNYPEYDKVKDMTHEQLLKYVNDSATDGNKLLIEAQAIQAGGLGSDPVAAFKEFK